MNQVRKYKINKFFKTIRDSRIRVSLSILDDIILKFHDKDIEKILESIHDLRKNLLYMLSFEKLVKEEQQTVKMVWDDEKQCIRVEKLKVHSTRTKKCKF